ncbi:MAG: large repetitive protein, partial [Actinomycetota bacterium]|nr:large repetitive protein [Actinomycetota bacterium]
MTNHLLTWRSAPPRRHWTVRGLAAWLAIALGAASLVFVTPAVRAAVSYNNGFINFTDTGATSMSYGPNETVEIALGQIHYLASSGCPSNGLADFITPIADIYVIPVGELAGLVADGDLKAHTPTHFPSAVAKAASDGSFWGTTIGFTYPSGALHTGEYAVVYDECQDGRLGSEDDVFSPVPGYPQGASDTGGFSVSIPAHVPLLPLAAITATKEAARLRAVDMSRVYAGTQIAFIISKWLDVSSVGGDTADKVMYWGMGFLGDSVANDPMEAAQNAIVSQIRLHTAIWKDPPDPNFEQPAGLPGRGAVLQNEADPFDAALAAVGQAGENEASIAQALLDAVQRYQGAAEAGDGTWALAHAREVRNFALALGDQLVDSSAASASFSSVVSAKATALDARSSEYAALRARLASDGFTDAEVQGLRNRGLSAAQVDQMLHAIAEGPAPVSSADLLAALAAGQADAAQAATAMTGLASAMNATIASLAGDVDVDPLAPSLSAGGPYTATAGSPATFTATGSDPVGIASYAWDLGSGTFADATGPIVSRTFAQAFDGWVGVEATDTVGRRSRSYAHVHVTGGNMPPRVTATTPSPAIVTVVENQTRDLSVSTSDTENDTVSVEWFVDNVATGATGLSYHYAPGTTHGGVHAIDAVVTDAGHPERGSSIARFAVSVTKPDADNDGWTSSSDCDDHDPATHPGLPEILFTGAVDACDLGAVDFPAGSAVAVSAPSSVQAGTWATVTAAVTALGASPAGAHVALQVSGAQNWALNATANANGIATFAYVAVLPGVDNYVATITGRGGDGATRSASSPSASTTITHIGPNPPRNLVATGDAGAAKLTWQAPVPNAFTVHGYEVTLTDPADPAHPAVHFVSPTQDTFTGLVNGTTYGVSIVARDLVAVRDSPPVTTNVTVMSHVPASATVSPPAQWNPKGRTVHVAATVNNGGGTPLPSVDLHFEIAGRNSQSGNVATGADGVATYS